MDWPVIGAVSAAVIVAGAVTFEVVVFMRSDPAPVRQTRQLASYGPTVERSANELPGFSTGRPTDWTPSFPLIPLIDSDGNPTSDKGDATKPSPTAAPAKKTPAKSATAKPAVSGDAPSSASPTPTTAPTEVKTAKLSTPEAPPPPVVQWRVVITEKASYFNLGGHVDSSGTVDSLASSHLRDALKSHRNFPQLPADVKTHILTQNINLNKLAPYRGLLGMNDKALEEEQAVRFVRVASR